MRFHSGSKKKAPRFYAGWELSSFVADCINKYTKVGADSKTIFNDIFVLFQGKWVVFKNKEAYNRYFPTALQAELTLIPQAEGFQPSSPGLRGASPSVFVYAICYKEAQFPACNGPAQDLGAFFFDPA